MQRCPAPVGLQSKTLFYFGVSPVLTIHTPTHHTFNLPTEGFIREKVVVSICGITKSTLWRWCAEGKFPRPVKLGPATTAWDIVAVRRWMESKRNAN